VNEHFHLRTTVPIPSEKHDPNTASLALVWLILRIHPTINRLRPPVVQVMVQLAISRAELQLFQEQRVIV
jgi:hypothetical protein